MGSDEDIKKFTLPALMLINDIYVLINDIDYSMGIPTTARSRGIAVVVGADLAAVAPKWPPRICRGVPHALCCSDGAGWQQDGEG